MLLSSSSVAAEWEFGGDQLDKVRRTRELVSQRLDEQRAATGERVRALYKLVRQGGAPAWLAPDQRSAVVRRRAAARRLLVRDLEERRTLALELSALTAYEDRLAAGLADARADGVAVPEPRSLVRPVRGRLVGRHGRHRHARSGAVLVRRGVELASVPDAEVVAAAAGRVLHTGPLGPLGSVVIVEAWPGLWTVTAGLGRVDVAPGDSVEAGQTVGAASGDRVYFEVRQGRRPVDPTGLLGRVY